MIKPVYTLEVSAEVIQPIRQYEIDWQRISEQVQEAADMVKNKEFIMTEMKKKNGKKKKGYWLGDGFNQPILAKVSLSKLWCLPALAAAIQLKAESVSGTT